MLFIFYILFLSIHEGTKMRSSSSSSRFPRSASSTSLLNSPMPKRAASPTVQMRRTAPARANQVRSEFYSNRINRHFGKQEKIFDRALRVYKHHWRQKNKRSTKQVSC